MATPSPLSVLSARTGHAAAAGADVAAAAFSVHVGGYAPNSEGIYSFSADPLTGQLRPLNTAPLARNPHSPSWLQADAAQPGLLYAVNEGGASIHVYRQHALGRLQLLQALQSGGQRPVHLSLHPSAPYALVAHYDSAELAVLRRAADGQLSMVGVHPSCGRDRPGDCSVGPAHAAKAPPGSFACSGHDAPHLHMGLSSPDGRFVLATDLGRDCLLAWPFDPQRGTLGAPQELALSPGSGPRHFVFHVRDASQLYLLHEESSTLAWLHMDRHSGRLSLRGELSSLPEGFAGSSFASDLLASADGRFLYALNRLHDSIAVFALGADGAPRLLAHEWTRGSYPRSARFAPGGRWLFVCNQHSDHVTVFALDIDTGLPRFTGQYVPVPSPACAEVMPLARQNPRLDA